MPRVEEPPNDFGEPLNISSGQTAPASPPVPSVAPSVASGSIPFPVGDKLQGQNGTTPAMPPHMASVKSHTADEIVQMMNRTPLFMTSLENAGYEDGENFELEAMRALQYEGTPSESAQGFKEQGNDMVKAKKWKDAKEFYTRGLVVLSPNGKASLKLSHAAGDVPSTADEEAETRKESEIEEACYVNRALCNLELKNYRSTTLDCASALRINPKNVKAFYRSSLALLALDKVAEASDACSCGLSLDPNNTALKSLKNKITDRQMALRVVQQKKQEREQRIQEEKLVLTAALRARNIRTCTTAQPPNMEDAAIHLFPDPVSLKSTIMFPTVLLYPLHLQSDFIKAFSETDTLPQHLEYIFPLPWDEEHSYTLQSVEYYMETGSGGLIKVGKNVSLGKVLGSDGVEILDGIVRINVVLKSEAKAWIEEMKARKGKRGDRQSN
ncbi:hypothetical protein N7G274_005591 [Stereocaulon virgatum]|uniref:Cns1/TTC4 wheel domain-containing protein n=1 Tax=Stereocaulon virgatum TaxID=373712 RepID=A0ABR4ABE2_9LECA